MRIVKKMTGTPDGFAERLAAGFGAERIGRVTTASAIENYLLCEMNG
jgi:hypothetical protein